MFDSFTTITDLYAVTSSGQEYHVGKVNINYNAYGNTLSNCTLRVLAKKSSKKALMELSESDVLANLEDFVPGTEVIVYCKMTGSDAPNNDILYRGFVASCSDAQMNTESQFRAEFEVTLSSPERLIPTNPAGSTYSVTRLNETIILQSNAVFYKHARAEGVLKQSNSAAATDLRKKLSKATSINIAEAASVFLDGLNDALSVNVETTPKTQLGELPTSLADTVDVSTAPSVVIPKDAVAAGGRAIAIADAIFTSLKALQISLGDWGSFVQILRTFYLNIVPNTDYSKSDYKYAKVVKGLFWDTDIADHITTEEYTTHYGVNPAHIAGNFVSVAVAYPQVDERIKPDELNSYAVHLLGYDKENNPKKYVGIIESGKLEDGKYALKESGMAVQNIRKIQLPNWAKSFRGKAGSNTTYRDWSVMIATAEAASSIGATGSLRVYMRFPSILKHVASIGRIVSIDVPSESNGTATRKLYGLLYHASIEITLENQRMNARGSITLAAVRDEKTQKVFSEDPGIFTKRVEW